MGRNMTVAKSSEKCEGLLYDLCVQMLRAVECGALKMTLKKLLINHP